MKGILPAVQHYNGIPGNILLQVIVVVAIVTFLFILYRRFSLLRLGQKDPRLFSFLDQLTGLLTEGILQRRQVRYPEAGILHIFIFWGFIVLGLRSVNLFAEGMFPGFAFPFMKGGVGAFYNSLKDIFEITTLGACMGAIYHRAFIKPKRYEGSHQLEAYLVLGLISILMITDLMYEGTDLLLGTPIPGVTLGSMAISWVFSGLAPGELKFVHITSYWVHILCLLTFLNLLPLSKHFHIITALPNVFLKKQVRGQLKPANWESVSISDLSHAGAGSLKDFTWKHMLDFFSCTECGRCTDNCSANLVGRHLSPKKVTMDVRDHGYREVPIMPLPSSTTSQALVGDVIQEDDLWACTTCGSCEEQCPVFIDHVDKIVDMRRHLVLNDSRFPSEFKQVFKNLEIYGDTIGKGKLFREDWISGVSVKKIYEETVPVDILFWTGCMGPLYDEKSKDSLRATAKVLNNTGLNWGILGKQERCCGDWARRVGNEYLFEQLAKQNVEILKKYKIQKLVTHCPHCFNTFKNEYPQLGLDIEVVHTVELLESLLKTGKLKIKSRLDRNLTYHDPCYLGRYNSIYDAPRKDLGMILKQSLKEMDRSNNKSFCCGAGGGNFWRGGAAGQRMEEVRIEEAMVTEANGIVTACPYCKIMFNSAVKEKGREHTFSVLDISEVVEQVSK